MAPALSSPQRYRGFVLTAAGLSKLHERLRQLEAQTQLRQTPRTIAERVQLSVADGIHPMTVRKILAGENGVDMRSIQLVFQVLQLQPEAGDYAHAGLCQSPAQSQIVPPAGLAETTNSLPCRDWSEAVQEPNLCGRESEFVQLYQAITAQHYRLVEILGMAGVGKTAFTTRLARAVEPEFEFVIWKSLHHAPSVQTTLISILQFLMQRTGIVELPSQAEDLTSLLVEQLQRHRCLIVLDHFDAILCAKQYAGYCRAGYGAYSELLQVIATAPHQSCLIITSREKPRAVGIVAGHHSQSLQLGGLSSSEGQQLLKSRHGLTGNPSEWQFLIEQYNGHPLILKTVAACIQSYFNGCISSYLTHLKSDHLLFADLRDLIRQQFERLSSVEQDLVYGLAMAQTPVSLSQMGEASISSLHQSCLLEGLDSLNRRSLLQQQGGYFSLNPLMRAYINEGLTEPPEHFLSKPKLEIVANHTVA